MTPGELAEALTGALRTLDVLEGTLQRIARRNDVPAGDLVDAQGVPVLLPVTVARVHALAALALLDGAS